MKLKKFGLLSFVALAGLLLTGCKTNAPELSFEETLKVYSEQTSISKEILSFLNDTGSQIQNKLDVETDYDAGDSIKGKLIIKTDIVNDNESKDTEAKVSLGLTTNSEIQEGLVIKSAKIDLNTLLKDFKIYFKLLDFSIDSNQQEYVAMITEIVNGFKDKWLTIDTDEYSNLLKMSSESNFDVFSYLKTNDNNDKLFSEKELTKYNGYPAWKVSFDEEEIKKLTKEVYEEEKKEAEKMESGDNSTGDQNELSEEDFNKMMDDLKIENSEAYFVIRSADKVDFVLKNIDIITAGEKINITDTINEKILGKDSEKIIITLSDVETESNVIIISIDLNPGLTSYDFKVRAEAKNGETVENLFNVEGDVSASLSEKTLNLKPNFKLITNSMSADVKVEFESNKIKDHKFETPKDAQDINEIIGGLLGGAEYDDEDYVYDSVELEEGEDVINVENTEVINEE